LVTPWTASNCELVVDFLSYKLFQKGYSNKLGRWEVIPMATVKQALREAGNEFELRYHQTFSDLMSQLHITPGTAYQSFEQVVYELFWDGVNWGDKEMQVLVSQITTWMATYLNDHLEPWIQDNGSWDTFVELFLWKQYSNPEPQGPRRSKRFIGWLILGILGLIAICTTAAIADIALQTSVQTHNFIQN
uniref:Apoptosis regulator Bcl-2 family BH4 domain-containing protein n=1 Tax=Bos mutus grunniens TaxID=30521 RepID=A0A8B9X4S5_BOSMU